MAAKHNRRLNVSRMDALRLHAEANKSDPFAAKRMAMTFARDGYREVKEVHAESKRILDAREAAVKAAYAAWLISEQRKEVVVHLGDRIEHSMSMYKNRADYDAAVAA